jgi:hypothetical protein
LHWGPWRKVLSVLQTGPWFTIHLSLRLCRKPPRVLRNRTRDPSSNGIVTASEEKGGGAYRRRGCSGEGSGEVQGSLAITSRCGLLAVVVGVGWSTCAGGGARRRRGIRPNQGGTVQLNGSGSFTRGQVRHVCEEFENGSPDCSVYARLWAIEVRRGRSWVSGEGLPGPRTWKASRAPGEANRATDTAWEWLEGAGRGGRSSGGLEGGGAACSRRSPVNFGSGRTESARGGTAEALGFFIGTAWCTSGRGPASAHGRAQLGAGARTGVNRARQPRSNTWSRCFFPVF